jgi:ADP-ribosylglycohydrolase
MPTLRNVPQLLVALILASLTRELNAQERPPDSAKHVAGADESVVITDEQLRDKIRGGLLGQMLGNLNGLPHEMKYIDAPGNVTSYVPALPDGARTDDDTDFEWVYIVEMQRQGTALLSPEQIRELWMARINRRIWCSNQYARQLMDLGLCPPLTGKSALNPWAGFNISGQFLCETFGLLAPGMPQTASQIGLNYTTAAISEEPAQTTQMFTTMIALAFVEKDIHRLLDAGVAATDPASRLRKIVADVCSWHSAHPRDWRATRKLVKEKYSRHNGQMRDRNGYELNTASTVAALLYGDGDFVKTLITAFNFGWDADNNAATAGTIVGVIRGYRWMLAQGWRIVDRYHNTTRDNMPNDETITSFADRVCELAELVLAENGGRREYSRGRSVFSIQRQPPACQMPFQGLGEQISSLRQQLDHQISQGLASDSREQMAQAAYLAICLDLDKKHSQRAPQRWERALQSLSSYDNVLQAMFYHSNVPRGEEIRRKALAAGVAKPAKKKPLW